MQLVATKITGEFFRAQTVTEAEITDIQTAMESDAEEELIFQIMTEAEFETWLVSQ